MPNVSNASSMRRRAAGVCLIAAPLTGLASAVVSPHLEGDAEKDLATIMFRQDAFLIGGLLGVLALVFLLGAVLGLLHLLRDRSVALGHIGGGLALLGVLGLFGLQTAEFVMLEAVDPSAARVEMIELFERLDDSLGFVVVFLMFLVGLNLGLVLLGIAAWRADIAPVWAAGTIPLSVVVLLLGRDKVVSASGFVLLAIGLGWIGRSVLAQSDAEWEGRVAASAPGAPEAG
jgi:hypothetical protein